MKKYKLSKSFVVTTILTGIITFCLFALCQIVANMQVENINQEFTKLVLLVGMCIFTACYASTFVINSLRGKDKWKIEGKYPIEDMKIHWYKNVILIGLEDIGFRISRSQLKRLKTRGYVPYTIWYNNKKEQTHIHIRW